MTVTKLYARLRESAATYNQLNQIYISLESYLTLEEIRSIRSWIFENPAEGSKGLAEKEWLRFFNRHVVSIHKPLTFNRVWHRRYSDFYSRTESKEDRKLIIGFTGLGGRLMMPNWSFLAALPHDVTDVLVIRTHWNRQEPNKAYPDRFHTIHEQIAHQLKEIAPRDVSTIGLSGGALPALVFGLAFKVNRIGLVSIVHSDLTHYPEKYRFSENPSVKDSNIRIGNMFTLKDKRAMRLRRWVKEFFPQTKEFVYLDGDHGLLGYLLRRGRLEKALRKLLTDDFS